MWWGSPCDLALILCTSGEWAMVQRGEVQGIKEAVGGVTACVKQFVEQQRDTARVNATQHEGAIMHSPNTVDTTG